MDHWIKNIELIRNSPSPIGVAIAATFKSIGRETWYNDPFIQLLINSPEFESHNTYQNQKKTAKVIYSCFTLLKNEITKGFEQHLVLLIFASLFHNFKHSGKFNSYPFENEKHSIEQMYEFSQTHNFMKLWAKHPWMALKNMPSWVNSTDAIEEIIFCADMGEIKNIAKNYMTHPEDLWRADLPIQINKLKQIFIEALIMSNAVGPFFLEENKVMMQENGITAGRAPLNKQIKSFLQNFALHVYISKASKELKLNALIQQNIHSL